MGLDLYLERKSDYERENYNEEAELAYGRKTWAIHDFFYRHPTSKSIDEDIVVEITKEGYLDLCKKVEPYLEYMTIIFNHEDDTDLDDVISEYIYNAVFGYDTPATLGYIWEITALYKWVVINKDNILKAFEEEPLVMIASY